jgi:hypothetical protein
MIECQHEQELSSGKTDQHWPRSGERTGDFTPCDSPARILISQSLPSVSMGSEGRGRAVGISSAVN